MALEVAIYQTKSLGWRHQITHPMQNFHRINNNNGAPANLFHAITHNSRTHTHTQTHTDRDQIAGVVKIP